MDLGMVVELGNMEEIVLMGNKRMFEENCKPLATVLSLEHSRWLWYIDV
jgi:hypothetical protein